MYMVILLNFIEVINSFMIKIQLKSKTVFITQSKKDLIHSRLRENDILQVLYTVQRMELQIQQEYVPPLPEPLKKLVQKYDSSWLISLWINNNYNLDFCQVQNISDFISDASKFVKSISLFPFPLGDAFLFELTMQLQT